MVYNQTHKHELPESTILGQTYAGIAASTKLLADFSGQVCTVFQSHLMADDNEPDIPVNTVLGTCSQFLDVDTGTAVRAIWANPAGSRLFSAAEGDVIPNIEGLVVFQQQDKHSTMDAMLKLRNNPVSKSIGLTILTRLAPGIAEDEIFNLYTGAQQVGLGEFWHETVESVYPNNLFDGNAHQRTARHIARGLQFYGKNHLSPPRP